MASLIIALAARQKLPAAPGQKLALTLLAGVLTAALALIFVQLFRFFGYLLANVDALLFFSSFYAERRFGSIADLQTFAFGQGFGAFEHPSRFNLFWWLLDWTMSVQLAHVVTEFLVFASIFVFTCYVSSNRLVCGVAAFLATSFFFYPALFVDHFGTVAPQVILQIGFAYLAIGLIAFGLRRPVWMVCGFALLLYVVVMDWIYFIFLVPLIGINLLALIFVAASTNAGKTRRGSLAWLSTGMALTAALVYLSGIPDAYDSFTLMSVRAWSFDSGLPEHPPSLLIWGGVTHQSLAIVVAATAILCMVYLTWLRRPFFAFACPLVLLYLFLLAIADIDSTGSNIYWTLPALGYFERPLIPFYAIVIACALGQLAPGWPIRFDERPVSRALSALERLRPARIGFVLLASGVAALAIVSAWIVRSGKDLPHLVYRPPYYWERTINFVKALPFPRRADAQFAPYFFDSTDEHLINDCPQLHDPDQPLRSPRYCSYMLNLYSVRNLFEAQNLSDLQTYRMHMAAIEMSRRRAGLKANGDDADFGLRGLKSFGVRYVAVDGLYENAVATRDIEGRMVSLIDLGKIEPQEISARSVQFARTYSQHEMVSSQLTGRALIHDERIYRRLGLLAPASEFSMEYRPGAVAVRARSFGESIVLLPFQFSHCLQLSDDAGAGAELLRVNGGQAALHFFNSFSGRISSGLTYFGDSRCRMRDFADVFRLGVWPVQSLDDLARGRRVPVLMQLYLNKRLRLRDQILRQSAPDGPRRASGS
jgi:hypothetical protein